MKPILLLISFSLSSLSCVEGQLTYRSNPELQWNARVQSVREGNGIFLSPNEEMIVASSNLGYISAFGARDGAEVFRYNYVPNSTDVQFISCGSGLAFALDYMVFSVLVNKNTANPLT